jgi:hypothetical protein
VSPASGSQRNPLAGLAGISKDRVVLIDIRAGNRHGFDVATSDKEILPSIVVEIVETRAVPCHRYACLSHAGWSCHFAEVSLAGVFVQWEGLVVQGDIGYVRIAVIIEVAEIESHAGDEIPVFSQSHTGIESDLFEFVSEIVKQELVTSVIGDEDVLASVEIVVRAHRFPELGRRYQREVVSGRCRYLRTLSTVAREPISASQDSAECPRCLRGAARCSPNGRK